MASTDGRETWVVSSWTLVGDAVVVHAVEQEVVLQGARAVDVHAARAPEGGAAALLGEAVALHAGDEREQVVPVADREGQLRHRVLLDDGPRARPRSC